MSSMRDVGGNISNGTVLDGFGKFKAILILLWLPHDPNETQNVPLHKDKMWMNSYSASTAQFSDSKIT